MLSLSLKFCTCVSQFGDLYMFEGLYMLSLCVHITVN